MQFRLVLNASSYSSSVCVQNLRVQLGRGLSSLMTLKLRRINPNSTEQSSGDTNRYHHHNIYCQDNLKQLHDLGLKLLPFTATSKIVSLFAVESMPNIVDVVLDLKL